MKKFTGEVLRGDGSCDQFDFDAETHHAAFEELMSRCSYTTPGSIGGASDMYPEDTVRLTYSVWEDPWHDQVWNSETKEWEDEEDE